MDGLVMGMTDDEMIKLVSIVGGLALGALWIVFAGVRGIAAGRQQEESRRELAAYVAEGSMTPEEAERILKAGRNRRGCCWS